MKKYLVSRRATLAALVALGLPHAAPAQQREPMRLVVPFPAGGTADILPRIVAEKLRTGFPGGVIVDNRPGAGGNIGADAVFRAKSDGMTLLASPPMSRRVLHLSRVRVRPPYFIGGTPGTAPRS